MACVNIGNFIVFGGEECQEEARRARAQKRRQRNERKADREAEKTERKRIKEEGKTTRSTAKDARKLGQTTVRAENDATILDAIGEHGERAQSVLQTFLGGQAPQLPPVEQNQTLLLVGAAAVAVVGGVALARRK